MIKLQIIGNLAHDNKLFDSTCKQCGGIYSRVETAVCPRCGNNVVPITAKNGRAMMVSEGTIYPLTTQDEKDSEAKARSKRRNSMEIVYRFVVLSFANAETGIVSEPRIHPYLKKGRQILLEINHNPIISHFRANDGSIKCEVRLGLLSGGKDTIKLLGKKEAMNNLTIPESTVTQIVQDNKENDKLLSMKAEIEKMIDEKKSLRTAAVEVEKPFDGMIIDETEDVNPF